MKSFKTLWIVLASLVLVFASVELDAQNGNGKKGNMNNNKAKKQMRADSTCDSSSRYQNFLDQDGDGNCDNSKLRTNNQNGASFVDANNDGVCDNQGKHANFVDANNDGVCDNQCSGRKGKGMKNGQGKGKGQRSGNCQSNDQTTIITAPASPNPFTNSTTISFETKVEGLGSVKLYDMNGNLIKNIYEGNFTVGNHTYTYNAENLTPGRYIVKVQQNNVIKSIPVVFAN